MLIGAALLALDLGSRGLAWRTFWSLTGEEAPVAQLRGMVELAGNALRLAPRTDPIQPIEHTEVSPFGINTFLEQEVELVKREQQVRLIAEAGFDWIRQQFPWEDIEISARGDFIDRRNDVNGDGQIDAISAWEKYDHIVGLAEQYGLQIMARLDNPPFWTHADPAIGQFAPPDDLQDFVNYAAAVAERYRGRIRYYQVWNEPNIYPEWGEQPVNPEAYTEMLCQTYEALKTVDPTIVVISGALAPTLSLDARNLNDFIFLQRMYDAGAGDCFDVLSVQGYGFFSGPTDRRLRTTTITFARNLYIRDLMIANGDADKAIWISEAAWNPVDAPEVPPDVSAREAYGVVTPEQAARFMPLGYQRAQEEWPWVGTIFYWFFKRATDSERGQSWYYFRMVEPDFTPMPVYAAMRDYIASVTPSLYPGVHQAEDWAITTTATGAVDAEGARFGRAVETSIVEFTARGTEVLVRWRDLSALQVEVDGAPTVAFDPAETWTTSRIHTSLLPETHRFRLTTNRPVTFDTITVIDRTAYNLFGYIVGALIFGVMLGYVVISAVRARRS